jgi:hypothetical protein
MRTALACVCGERKGIAADIAENHDAVLVQCFKRVEKITVSQMNRE